MYQSEVLRQELDTRDELGFGDEMVLVKMLMRLPSPDERSVGDDDRDDFPLPEGSAPGRTALPEP